MVCPLATPFRVAVPPVCPAATVTDDETVATAGARVEKLTTRLELGAGEIVNPKLALLPGPTSTSAGSEIWLWVVVTVTAVAGPLNPPVAVPPMLQPPDVAVEVILPGEAELSVCPAAKYAAANVST